MIEPFSDNPDDFAAAIAEQRLRRAFAVRKVATLKKLLQFTTAPIHPQRLKTVSRSPVAQKQRKFKFVGSNRFGKP
jgi:hypothetical protein